MLSEKEGGYRERFFRKMTKVFDRGGEIGSVRHVKRFTVRVKVVEAIFPITLIVLAR